MKNLSNQIKLYGLHGLYGVLDILENFTYSNSFIVKKKYAIGSSIISLYQSLNSVPLPTNRIRRNSYLKIHKKQNFKPYAVSGLMHNGSTVLSFDTCVVMQDNGRTCSTLD